MNLDGTRVDQGEFVQVLGGEFEWIVDESWRIRMVIGLDRSHGGEAKESWGQGMCVSQLG